MALGCIVGGLLTAVPAGAAETPQTAVGTFGSCVAGGGAADVLLLIDESSSLTSTDAAGARVTSATYLVDQLASFVGRTKADVSVQLAGFGDRYDRMGGWRPVRSSGNGGITTALAAFRGRTAGFDTDYWTALHRAQLDLAARARSSEGRRCQAVLWFTDGSLGYFPRRTAEERSRYGTHKLFAPSVDLTSSAAATKVRSAAVGDLCRNGGVADQLRVAGVDLIGIGLGPAAQAGQFDLMKRIATGSAAGTPCGDQAAAAPGAFYRASDIEGLLRAFDQVSTPDAAPINQSAGICSGGPGVCVGGSHRFVLDASTPEVQILATVTASGLTGRLQAPSGAVFDLGTGGSGSAVKRAATARYRWITGKALSISLDRGSAKDSDWTGVWRFGFVAAEGAPAKGRSESDIHILSGIRPAVSGSLPQLHQGTDADLHVGLVGPDGKSVDPASLLGKLHYTARFRDAAGRTTTVLDTKDKAGVTGAVKLPLGGAAVGGGALVLTADITTASVVEDGATVPGTTLAPAAATVPLQVLAPAAYPRLSQTVDFGTVEGSAAAKATARLTGSGCAWLVRDSMRPTTTPQDVRGVRIDSGADSRDACATGSLDLALHASGSGNGALTGTVQIATLPADRSGRVVTVPVAVVAQYERPLDRVNFLAALLAALILGPGIPLLLMYLLKLLVTRIPSRPLVAALAPVRVGPDGVLRDGARFAVLPGDFSRSVDLGRGGRRVDAAGFVLRARTGASPFGVGTVRVDTPGLLAASDTDPIARRDVAKLPLAVHGHFVVLRRPGSPDDTAEILLLIGADAGADEQRRLGDEVDRRGTELVTKLLELEHGPGAPGPAASDPFVGATPGPSDGDTNTWGF